MCVNDQSPSKIRSETPDSLYNSLENKWRIAIEKEQEIREKVFAQYFLDLSNFELFEVINQNKGLFFTRRRRLWLLEGRIDDVEKDTHLHMMTIVHTHEAHQANKKVEQESEISKPDEVYDSEGEPVTEQMEPIDVEALDGEKVTQGTPSEGTG